MFDPDGSDIIFVVGAPGSKWSAIAHAIMYADGVNLSDLSLERSHAQAGRAMHFGNYFGPGMEFGQGFVDLPAFSKSELLDCFAAPYREEGGIKLLKSHFFSAHLPFLAETFPKARFILVYRPDAACLDWWKQAGGFSISFPDYSWYEDFDRMAEQIAEENRSITQFAAARGVKLVRRRTLKPLLDALGLEFVPETLLRVSSLEFERRYGFGLESVDKIEQACHATARLAATAVA